MRLFLATKPYRWAQGDGCGRWERSQSPKTLFPPWVLCAFATVCALSTAARAQTVYNTASLAVPLVNLEGSARDLAMGSAFVGVADDASAVFFNPAGLTALKNPEIALHHNSYLAGTFQETLNAGFPAGDAGGIAFALDYIGWGNLDLRDAVGTAQGSYADSDIGFTAAWGKEWLGGFSVGLALRGVQQKVVNDLYASLSGDIGILWQPAPRLRLGAAALNLGPPVAGSSLASQFNGGGSYLWVLGSPKTTLLTALSVSAIPGGEGSVQAGAEGTLEGKWSLRAGYQVPFQDPQTGGLTGFTAGAGMKLGALALDYAYVPFGDLGTSNRISLSFQFDLPKEVVKVQVQVPVTVVQPVLASPNSKDVEVHFKINTDPLAEGQELEKEGKTIEAARDYVDALKADPQNDRLWAALGRLYYQLGKKTYAIQCFENALKLKPQDATLKDWLEKYKNSSDPP